MTHKGRINGLSEIAMNFDGMLIDQFGVIHDGQKLYPSAAEVLAKLHALRIPVVIMTNSGKRAQASTNRTVKMGIPREHFVDCVSSGEVAFQLLAVKRAFLVGKRGEEYGFDGVDFVDDPHAADMILILGSNAPETSLAEYEEIFRGLTIPAVCCNPDKLMITPQGLQPAPGAIAEAYERLGGAVRWVGKPYPEIYQFALAKLGSCFRGNDGKQYGDDGLNVLCIGDSPEHDVAGGRGAGLSTLLVQQGVSADLTEDEFEPKPDYIMSRFQWDG